MLTDIEALKKEIETFHKNVKDSNELTSLLSDVIRALENESKTFDEKTKEIEDTADALLDKIKAEDQSLIEETKKELERIIREYEAAQCNYQKKLEDIPRILSERSAEQYNLYFDRTKREIGTYMTELSETQIKTQRMSAELDEKYNAFLTKLRSTNTDQIYKTCLDMDKKINARLTILLGGVGAAVLLSVIAVIMQL